jgi:hypothetical protein
MDGQGWPKDARNIDGQRRTGDPGESGDRHAAGVDAVSATEGEEEQSAPRESDAPDEARLPVARASQIVSDIVDQAPLYGLSGAILAVGLVTGRRALARSGARMLTNQLIVTVASAAMDRVRLGRADPTDAPPREEPPPSKETAAPAKSPGTAKLATGALVGVAAAAAGGWLLSRLLARKRTEDGP